MCTVANSVMSYNAHAKCSDPGYLWHKDYMYCITCFLVNPIQLCSQRMKDAVQVHTFQLLQHEDTLALKFCNNCLICYFQYQKRLIIECIKKT